jgi:polygalacturonase
MLLIVVAILALLSFTVDSCQVSLSDFNAYGNGVDYDDAAMKSALDACKDGGSIIVPAGKYLLSPFNLTSNMWLYLDEGSTLLASPDHDRWPIVPPFPSYPDVSLLTSIQLFKEIKIY